LWEKTLKRGEPLRNELHRSPNHAQGPKGGKGKKNGQKGTTHRNDALKVKGG